jgi:hypothetical protein
MQRSLKDTKIGAGPRDIRDFRGVKQINVFPMVIMLIAIILLVIWLRPH